MLRLKNFARNQKGGAAILFAVSATVMIGFGAMAVDVGNFFYEKRKLQTAIKRARHLAPGALHRRREERDAQVAPQGDAEEARRMNTHWPARDQNLCRWHWPMETVLDLCAPG